MSIGVEITTSLRSGPSNPGRGSGRLHIPAVTEKGPVGTTPIVRSLAQYESIFGGRTAYSSAAYDTARLFWEEGGSELAVTRVVGPNAAVGSITLNDRAATPLPTLRVDAVDPGAHSSTTSVQVVANGSNFDIIVRVDGGIVQRFDNLATRPRLSRPPTAPRTSRSPTSPPRPRPRTTTPRYRVPRCR